MADTCGAKTRGGGECKKAPISGKSRCKLHGGKSTGNPSAHGNQSAVKHGIYSTAFLPGEEAIEPGIRGEVGRIEEELLITRLRLRRALAAEAKAIQENDFLVVESETDRGGDGKAYAATETTKKRVDYTAIIDRLTARVESLEKTRAELAKGNGDEPPDSMTRDDTFIAPDGPVPDAPVL